MKRFSDYLHIVSFDVPYPASYGGVIDIFHRIKALAALGIKIKLHCYQYGREQSKVLEKYCHSVNYYPRKTFKNPFYGKLPYIVNSRNSSELLHNLIQDDGPIMFEGLHCTFYLDHPALAHRFKIVRTHNVEHHYYKQLEKVETRYFKKYFFRLEAEKLKKHQHIMKHAQLIAAISPNDRGFYARRFHNVCYLPAFHSNQNPKFPAVKGEFILYHGNLGVPENYSAASQLVKEVFSKIKHPCIIAGNNPPRELQKLVENYKNVELRSGISTEEIHQLIKKAHINVLYTKQATGIKLKLLNALFQGKFLIANPLMVVDTGIEQFCDSVGELEGMAEEINKLMLLNFSKDSYQERLIGLSENFNNDKNAQYLLSQIGPNTGNLEEQEVGKEKKNLTLISLLLSFFLP